MITGKVRTVELKGGGRFHKVCVYVTGEQTGPGVPASPIDFFAGHIPDAKFGAVRRLVKARTNRAGTVLVALVRDSK